MTSTLATRLAAMLALAAWAGALAVLVVYATEHFFDALGAFATTLLAVAAAWLFATRRAVLRWVAGVMAVVAIVGAVVLLALNEAILGLVVYGVAVAVASGATSFALRLVRPRVHDLRATPCRHAVLLMNPWSGGGKVERFHLVDECHRRGIEPVVLQRGDDLRQLALDAVARGADMLGMAGGDGSQAIVAQVAMENDLPYVCIPAGTRNHLALDLGVDRNDVVGALDGFTADAERRIDLATVNGSVFVNNVSLGVYASIVQSDEYRDAKVGTTMRMLPELLGPDATPFDLHYPGPDGHRTQTADILMVSNDPYRLDRLFGMGSRPRMDRGELGIVSVRIESAGAAARFLALESTGRASHFEGWSAWTSQEFVVDSSEPVPAGVDGEALTLDPPLRFATRPRALRVRISPNHPGRSPAAQTPESARAAVKELTKAAFGRTEAVVGSGR